MLEPSHFTDPLPVAPTPAPLSAGNFRAQQAEGVPPLQVSPIPRVGEHSQ
jgi:hypothetical protein